MTSEPQEQTQRAARAASAVTEVIEVLWGRGREATTAPVSPSQLKVLFVLENEDGVNLRNVTERLGSTAPSTSRLCDRLEAVGFVNRTPSPISRRELRLWLTDEGRSFLQDLRDRREKELRKVISRMPPGKQTMLLEGLVSFHEAAAQDRGADARDPRPA